MPPAPENSPNPQAKASPDLSQPDASRNEYYKSRAEELRARYESMRTLEWQMLLQTYAGYAGIAVAFQKADTVLRAHHSSQLFIAETVAILVFFSAMHYIYHRIQERLITFDTSYEFYAAKRRELAQGVDAGAYWNQLKHPYFWTYDTQTIISALVALCLIGWEGVFVARAWILPIVLLLVPCLAVPLWVARRRLRRLLPNLIWYASYGSNLARKRFLCYIKGGTPPGSSHENPGCRDKSKPLDVQPIRLPYELFFAGYFDGWQGAAAFIRRGPASAKTFGRMYLVTEEQFNDIVLQENNRAVDGTQIVPNLDELRRREEHLLSEAAAYGRLMVIGHRNGHPVVTFTSAEASLCPGCPSPPYLEVIAAGLRETYPALKVGQIADYLSAAEGLRNVMGWREVADLVATS